MEGIYNVAGAMMRTGSTTLALQLVRGLQANHYNAAYVEMNPQNYIHGVNRIYNGVESSAADQLEYAGIHMFSKKYYKELTSGKGEYDYLICDYGSMMCAKSFDMSAFTNCDACIITAGVKPNEMFQTNNVLLKERSGELVLPIYAMYMVPREDEEYILEEMVGMEERTFFIPTIDDPFADMPFMYRQFNDASSGRGAGFIFDLLSEATKVSQKKAAMKRAGSFKRVKNGKI